MKILLFHRLGGAAVLLSDHFTGSDGTNLTAHTMDVGPGWTTPDGSYELSSNRAVCTALGGGWGIAIADAGRADAIISVVVRVSDGSRHGVAVRATNGNNHWRVTIRTAGVFELMEVNAGTSTIRSSASTTINTGVDYTIACMAQGPTLTATLDGAHAISYGGATFQQTTTTHGLDDGNNLTSTFNDFLVTSL